MTGTVQTQVEAQIRELMDEKATALRARDAETLVAQYAPDAVTFDLAPPLQKAGPEVHDVTGRRTWFSGFDGDIAFEIRDLSVTAGADLAYCHSLNSLTATPHGAPDSFTLWFRATVCLRKVDGSWLISHEHTSTPFYMDGSFKAAVDLQP
jgi:ketosteroid isomerase-like protein